MIQRAIRPRTAIATAVITAALLGSCGLADDADAEFDAQPAEEDSAPEADQSAPDSDADGADTDSAGIESADEGTDAEDAPDAGAADEAGAGDQTGADDDDATGAGDGGYIREADQAIETLTYELSEGSNDGTEVTVGLHSLEVDGETMLLELSFTHDDDGSSLGLNNLSMGRGVYPTLIDRDHLKEYRVIGSGGNRWASGSSVSSTPIRGGQTLMYYAYYAAPQDDVETMDVDVVEGLVQFTDVEIEQ